MDDKLCNRKNSKIYIPRKFVRIQYNYVATCKYKYSKNKVENSLCYNNYVYHDGN